MFGPDSEGFLCVLNEMGDTVLRMRSAGNRWQDMKAPEDGKEKRCAPNLRGTIGRDEHGISRSSGGTVAGRKSASDDRY
jgi:hypothetical protein